MDLATLLKSAGGGPVEHAGRTVQASLTIPVATGDTLCVEFNNWAKSPLQGLAVKCNGCSILVAGKKEKYFGLWMDTSPRTVELLVATAREGAGVVLKNQWKLGRDGLILMGLGNAGMEVRKLGAAKWTVHCNDGTPGLDFADLVFTLDVVKNRNGQE